VACELIPQVEGQGTSVMYSNRTSIFAYAAGVIAIGVVGLLLGAAWIGVFFCTEVYCYLFSGRSLSEGLDSIVLVTS
jgi:hypothetical protein